MRDYSDLVPDEFYSEAIPTRSEHDFLYLGAETINFFSLYWRNHSASLIERSIGNEDWEEYLDLVSEAQECRKRANFLADIAPNAENKPLIFRQNPYLIGQRVTCFVQSPRPDRPDRFIDSVVLKVQCHGPHDPITYWLKPYRQNVFGADEHRFVADKVSLIQTDDFHYLRTHPNFFRLFLNLRATTEGERQKIEPILSAL